MASSLLSLDDSSTAVASAGPAAPILTSGRIPSLDGLRAICILMVLFGHLSGTRGFLRLNFGIGDYAHLGVVVFFIISGFLITTLLMDEYRRRGTISLKLFYERRSLRIFPASYGYLAIVGLLGGSGILHLSWQDLLHGITYTVNYAPSRSWQVGHLWSLSVEEQFYLLWPFAFSVLYKRRSAWAIGAWAAFGVFLLGIVARGFNRVVLVGTPMHDLEMFPMVADSLAAGCLLALLRAQLEQRRWYLRLFHPAWSLLLLALVLVLNRYSGFTVAGIFGTSAINLAVTVLVHRSVYLANSPISVCLNWRPVVFVGVLSYSLYIWQQLFLNRESGAWMNAFPQNLCFVFAAALTSYYLLEKPFLGLRHRLRTKVE